MIPTSTTFPAVLQVNPLSAVPNLLLPAASPSSSEQPQPKCSNLPFPGELHTQHTQHTGLCCCGTGGEQLKPALTEAKCPAAQPALGLLCPENTGLMKMGPFNEHTALWALLRN